MFLNLQVLCYNGFYLMKKSGSGIKLFFLAAFLVLCSVSCASKNNSNKAVHFILNDSDFIPADFLWEPVTAGIERFDFENPSVPLVYHAVKIDLDNPKLELVCFPDSKTKTNSRGFFRGQKTSTFAKKNNCLVAVNAAPFEGKFIMKKIAGIHICNKEVLSPANSGYAAIAFSKDGGAEIIKNQTPALSENFDFAFGGFFVVLEDDEVIYSFADIYDSRCGAGISKDGKRLYLLVVEGEQKSRSIGLTYPQCAKIFSAMGCSNALELDGGGSTQLCIKGKSVLNYPSLRIQSSCFGFREKE